MFSYPELVQQLIEGFAPPEIAALMDFSTLQLESGHYITPLFEEKREDLVWSVQAHWQGRRQTLYLYLLIEFQSRIDQTMPLRLMHYVAGFYSHLLKTKQTTARRGLPPVFPIVLYNGLARWSVQQDIFSLIKPEVPDILRAYQPRLRYYLIDEGAYSDEQLEATENTVSGVFSIEKASHSKAQMERVVARMVHLIQQEPHKERIDKVVTRWLKRHFHRLGDTHNWERIHSLSEDHAMITENLKTWAEKERAEGMQQGIQQGIQKGIQKGIQQGYQKARIEAQQHLLEVVLNMIQAGLPDEQVMSIAKISAQELAEIKAQQMKH